MPGAQTLPESTTNPDSFPTILTAMPVHAAILLLTHCECFDASPSECREASTQHNFLPLSGGALGANIRESRINQ